MYIKDVFIETPLFLAPMAGVTDLAFRKLCREQGAGVTVSEMVSSRALVFQDKKSNRLLGLSENEHPSSVQIFGNEPAIMAQAASLAHARSGADMIDINMGCPTPKIVNNGDGCALMKNPRLAGEIIRAVKSAVDCPVTVKCRTGWDASSINLLEFVSVCEESGADAICIHGRTRQQMYSGKANWDRIRDAVKLLSIPVIANGDITCAEDCVRLLSHTGAQGVMIGRAAFGNPFLFAQAKAALSGAEIPPLPPLAERLEVALRQVALAIEDKGEHIAILEARKYLAWYLRGVRGANYYKDKLFSLTTQEETLRLVRELQHVLQ